MFCPNCGSKNSIEQKFCRSCGLNLEKSAESLLEQSGNVDIIQDKKISKIFETIGKLGFGGTIGAVLAGVIILIIALIQKFILSGQTDKIIGGIVFITLIISAVLGLAYVVFQEYSKEKLKKANAQMSPQIEGKETGKLLEEKFLEPIPSITERTTDLLFAESNRKTSGDLR